MELLWVISGGIILISYMILFEDWPSDTGDFAFLILLIPAGFLGPLTILPCLISYLTNHDLK